jgi:hypothetical protein
MGVVAVVVILALCVYIFYMHTRPRSDATDPLDHRPSAAVVATTTTTTAHATPPPEQPQQPQQPESAPTVTTNIFHTTPQYTHVDPMLQPPLRRSPNTVHRMGMMPINIETRGVTPDIQQVGILRSKNNDSVLALFGRPTYRGSSKWTYYTATDKFHSIKLPVEKNNRDCTASNGCDELYEDDDVKVLGQNGVFQASIYQLDAPRYIPFVA